MLNAWVGDWTTVPDLRINGFGLSLAGLALPLLASPWLLRGLRVADLPQGALYATAASWAFNAAGVMQQRAAGFPSGGVHLLPLIDTMRMICRQAQPEYIHQANSLHALPGIVFLSVLPTDLLGSMLMAQQSDHAPRCTG